MPKSQETLNTELDDLISSHGFDVIAMDSSGKEVPVPDEAELFQFHFHRNGQDLGTVTCTIDGNKDMAVYYDDKITKLGEGDSVGSEISWLELVKQLKRFALNRQLTFKLKDTDRLRTDMKRRAHVQKQETSLYEGWSGNKHTSYNDANKSVKIVVKHNKKLEENDARFRYIDKIFLETAQGERLLVPTTKPSQARMFARHIAEGGDYRDERWEHINEVCQDVNQLAKFVRATKDKKEQFNESAGRMIDEAISKYAELKKLAESLQTSRGYNKYFESYSPSMIIESDDEILEAFTTNSLDSRIKESAGVLAKYGIKYNKIKESSSFERWADDIIGEALDLDNNDPKMDELIDLLKDSDFKVGPDADVAIGALDDIIENDDLFAELKKVAAQNANSDAAPTIISWMQQQNNPQYKKLLDKLGVQDSDAAKQEPEPQPEPQPEPESANQEPVQVQPEQPPAQPAAPAAPPPDEVMPPLAENDELKALLKLLK